VSEWVNGRLRRWIDCRDRGLQYGDGLFETMRVRGHRVRFLDYHLERLFEGCRRLKLDAPEERLLRREITTRAAERAEAVLKLIVTRGIGARGYRPSGEERPTRVLSLHRLPPSAAAALRGPVRIRLCHTRLGSTPALAGLKTLNRLESVLARAEWHDARIWEGLMRDEEGNVVSGTMSNVFVRRGSTLLTPSLERCGIAGVMRRWVLEQARHLGLEAREGRLNLRELDRAEEVFMTNAVCGVVSVAMVQEGRRRIRPFRTDGAERLRARLERE